MAVDLNRQTKPVNYSDVSFVVQGPIADSDASRLCNHLRATFPGSPLIYSACGDARSVHGFDRVAWTSDPGPMPPLKFDKKVNNVNRQRRGTLAGLRLVETPMAIKLRSDSLLYDDRALRLWDQVAALPRNGAVGHGRILTSSFITLNPRYLERLPYHVSDIFQLGYTEDLLRYWSAPDYPLSIALHYQFNRFAPRSTPEETMFRSKFAVEQWMCLHYLFGLSQNWPIHFHNDVSDAIIEEFERHLANNFIVANHRQLGLWCPVLSWASESAFFQAVCYSFD
ncbi:hypothetical protein EON80_17325, partial [bacterium]